jgi:uncharacterized protein YndB with AHSA1/START domain
VTEAIRTDSFFPHPPEKVWRALTDPEVLASWLMPEDDPHQQATMRILGGGWAGHLARRLGHALASGP